MENKRRLQSLRSARDFETLRNKGQAFHPARWLMVSYRPQELGIVRCAWTISRAAAPSVVRNRLRRWGREFFRSWSARAAVAGIDFNLIFKRQNKDFYRHLDHAEFDHVLRKVVSRFEKAME